MACVSEKPQAVYLKNLNLGGKGSNLDLCAWVGLMSDEPVILELPAVTALSPVIGYDKAASIAHEADRTGLTLRDAALSLGYISAEEFDRVVDPASMVGDIPEARNDS